jgi:hypothetical protein
MKVLVDMNLSPEWIPTLNAAGFEAIHWSSIGNPKPRTWRFLNGPGGTTGSFSPTIWILDTFSLSHKQMDRAFSRRALRIFSRKI